MSKTKHTPGPWQIIGSDNATPHIMTHEAAGILDREFLVCAMPAEISHSYNSWANARLIAAAPDLLEALQEFVDNVCCENCMSNGFDPEDKTDCQDCSDLTEKARAAIARASEAGKEGL